MPNWKKLVTSGSDAYLNSVTVDGPVINDLTASYAITALNTYNSTALNSGTVQRIPTASATWSIQHNLHELWPMVTIWEENPSFVYTMVVPNNIVSLDANTVEVTFTEPIRGYVNVSRAGHVVSGSVPWTNLIGPAIITASLDISGSVTATGGFTGSLFGTSSWALNSISSSYSLSSSYAVSSSFAVTASHAVSASFATSASFARSSSFATTASFAVTASHAVSASFATTSSFATTASFATTSSFARTASFAVTASHAVSALSSSFATTASFADTSSFALTASYVDGNIVTASYVNPLTQSVYITGGLNIEGDAFVSGAIRMYQMDDTNLEIEISSSYIYTSTSINDIFFTRYQNSPSIGTSRLTWYEGNLRTGLINGGLLGINPFINNQVIIYSGSGIFVDTYSGYFGLSPNPTVQTIEFPEQSLNLIYRTSHDVTYLALGGFGQIVQQTTPFTLEQCYTNIPLGYVTHYNRNTLGSAISSPQIALDNEQSTFDNLKTSGPIKISGLNLETGSFSLTFNMTSGSIWRDGANPFGTNQLSVLEIPSVQLNSFYRYYASGSGVAKVTASGSGLPNLDPTKVNLNNEGVLTNVTSSKFTIQKIFLNIGGAPIAYYGSKEYDSIAEAYLNLNIEPFIEDPETKQYGVYLGSVILRGDATNFNTTSSYQIIPAGMTRDWSEGSKPNQNKLPFSLENISGTASYASSSLNTQDVLIYVKNANAYPIPKGTVVRISGATGDNPLISTASYESDPVSANTLGITNQTIPADSFGYVMTEGTLYGINTNEFTPGQLLYLGPTGSIIGTVPIAPLHNVRLGQVLRVQQNNGSMYVRIDNGYELDELHDVKITSASFGDTIIRSGSVWINSKQLSGSYGITGSLNITGSLQINTSKTNAGSSILTSGSNNTFINEPLNSYKSLHVKYHIIGASGARAGNIMSIVSGSQVQYIETTTGDIGNTDGLILTVALTNGNQNITVQYNNQSGTNFTFTSEYTLL